jgi:hypothetical protein
LWIAAQGPFRYFVLFQAWCNLDKHSVFQAITT